MKVEEIIGLFVLPLALHSFYALEIVQIFMPREFNSFAFVFLFGIAYSVLMYLKLIRVVLVRLFPKKPK